MGNGASQVGAEEAYGTDNIVSIKDGKGTQLVHRKVKYATDASSTFSYTGVDGKQVCGFRVRSTHSACASAYTLRSPGRAAE